MYLEKCGTSRIILVHSNIYIYILNFRVKLKNSTRVKNKLINKKYHKKKHIHTLCYQASPQFPHIQAKEQCHLPLQPQELASHPYCESQGQQQ